MANSEITLIYSGYTCTLCIGKVIKVTNSITENNLRSIYDDIKHNTTLQEIWVKFHVKM